MATRRVKVPPSRLERWLHTFDERHQIQTSTYRNGTASFSGADGEQAQCTVPFGPLAACHEYDGLVAAPLLEHLRIARRVGVILVRLGGYAVGVFEGQKLVVSKVDSRLVHGRHKKGGSSSGRFARRRENEARRLIDAAVATVMRVVLPHVQSLDAVVLGGDRDACRRVLADARLQPLTELVRDPFLTVPDPKLRILQESYEQMMQVTIVISDGPGINP